jgi:hypothetical protein
MAAGRPPVDSTPTPSFSVSSQVFKVLCAFIYGVASFLSQKFPGQLIGRHTMNPTPITGRVARILTTVCRQLSPRPILN